MSGFASFVSVLAGLFACTAAAATFDVTAWGAKPDGKTDCTAAIQKAIDDCSAAGGGRVLVPGGGVYKTYTLNLKNGVDLHIDRGATLKGGEDPYKYPEFQPTPVWNVARAPRFNKRAMFYTVGQTNVAITGMGTIDGNASGFFAPTSDLPDEGFGGKKLKWNPEWHPAMMMAFYECANVRRSDANLINSCFWNCHLFGCENVQVRGLRIKSDPELCGDDGIAADLLERGATGVISVVGNALPALFAQLTHAALQGDRDTAHALQSELAEMCRLMMAEGNPGGIKALLALQGKAENVLRLPLVPVSQETNEKIKQELERI